MKKKRKETKEEERKKKANKYSELAINFEGRSCIILLGASFWEIITRVPEDVRLTVLESEVKWK